MTRHTPHITDQFQGLSRTPSTQRADEMLLIRANINLFLDSIEHYKTEEQINTPEAEEDLKNKFRAFLIDCRFYSALQDFEDLVRFKSGKNAKRSDGTVNWYHEFIPIVNDLALIRAGKKNGGMDIEDLEAEGGLPVLISTKLNHDMIEDTPITKKKFLTRRRAIVNKTASALSVSMPGYYTEERKHKDLLDARLTGRNVWLVSKKTVNVDQNGEPIVLASGKYSFRDLFTNTKEFFTNLLNDRKANPIAFSTKLGDVSINLATLTNSKKHDTAKKKTFCNIYEDSCGPRQGLSADAIKKWPTYKNMIDFWDNTMGSVMYLEFSWLEYVEYAYPGEVNKYQKGDPVSRIYKSGMGRYLDKSLSIPVPRFASALHTALDRKRKIAETDPQAKVWLERSIYPALADHKQHFPEIFAKSRHRRHDSRLNFQ